MTHRKYMISLHFRQPSNTLFSALNKSNLMLGGLCSSKIELLFYTNDDYIKKFIFANLV
jgi:hypothetical protein